MTTLVTRVPVPVPTLPTPPVPRPPSSCLVYAVADRPMYSEFAHIRKASVGDRAAVFVGRWTGGVGTARIVWQGTPTNSNLAALDAFIDLVAEAHTLDQPLVVALSTVLMRQLDEINFTDPHVVLGARIPYSYLAETFDLQQAWLAQSRAAIAPRVQLIATDASVGLGRGSAGIACVDDRGHYQSRHISSRDVLYCELEAISMALAWRPSRLQILTDSRLAIRLIAGHSRPKTAVLARVVGRIRRQLAGREVTTEWVRGHSGHQLNEAADQLAMAARRRFEFGIPSKTHTQICRRITAELRTT